MWASEDSCRGNAILVRSWPRSSLIWTQVKNEWRYTPTSAYGLYILPQGKCRWIALNHATTVSPTSLLLSNYTNEQIFLPMLALYQLLTNKLHGNESFMRNWQSLSSPFQMKHVHSFAHNNPPLDPTLSHSTPSHSIWLRSTWTLPSLLFLGLSTGFFLSVFTAYIF